MPSGVPTDRLLAGFLSVYQAAELALTDAVAAATKKTARKELSAQLAEATRLRRDVQRIVARLDDTAKTSGRGAVEAAGQAAHAQAVADLASLGVNADRNELLAQAQLDQIARSLTDVLTPAHLSVTRVIDDQYRRVVGANIGGAVAGADTQRQAMQKVMDDFARRGITGFTDRAGRRWELSAYAEMATRTALVRASLEAYTTQLRGSGVTLVRVSDSPQECPLCRPWESKILTLDPAGDTGQVEVEHFLTDEPMTIEVAGTLAQARALGLFHPNCSHALAPYKPGVTRLPQDTANPEGYEARQKLRALERRVRRSKRLEAAALDPKAKKAATAQVKAGQKAIRDHVRDTEAVRQPHREQLMDGDAAAAVDRFGEFRPGLEPERLDPDAVRPDQDTPKRLTPEEVTADYERKVTASPSEMEMLESYTGGGYLEVNRWLRDGQPPDSFFAEHASEHVRELDRLMGRYELPSATTLWRRVQAGALPDGPIERGTVIQPGGYQSTSFSDDVPGFKDYSTSIEILAPEGMNAIVVNGVDGGVLAEDEVILPHDVQFRVESDETRGNKRWLRMTAVPPSS